jgi:hypothetical protein
VLLANSVGSSRFESLEFLSQVASYPAAFFLPARF